MKIPFLTRSKAADTGGGNSRSSQGTGSRANSIHLPIDSNFINFGTGAGTSSDHMSGAAFHDVRLPQAQLEIIYRVSWAAAKMIDIPVDDMFVPGRRWKGENEEAVKAMEEAERALGAHDAMRKAMKAARLYGTGLLIILSKDASPETPLEPTAVRPDSIANLLVVDRWAASIEDWHIDPLLPRYGKPYSYRISPRIIYQGESHQFIVHHSRVLRFDGIRPPLSEGWNHYDRDWGASTLARAINQIGRNEAISVSLNHLLQEASVSIVKIQGFKAALQGKPDVDDPPLTMLAQSINMLKSVFRTGFIDREDEAQRLNVAFGGIADIVNGEAQRLAAIADIPMTRFFAQSPAGQNATGDSDWQNYAVRVAAMQEDMLTAPLMILDEVVAKNAGLQKALEYEWTPLRSMTPEEESTVNLNNTQALVAAMTAGGLTEEEFRDRLANMELFGELPPMTDQILKKLQRISEGPPDPEPDDPPPPDDG